MWEKNEKFEVKPTNNFSIFITFLNVVCLFKTPMFMTLLYYLKYRKMLFPWIKLLDEFVSNIIFTFYVFENPCLTLVACCICAHDTGQY